MKTKKIKNHKGFILISTVVFAIIAVAIIVALTSWFGIVFKSSKDLIVREQAFHFAEAGLEYYRWYLAHNPNDYFLLEGQDFGEYTREIKNTEGQIIGDFNLKITPPNDFSNLVIAESTGRVFGQENLNRKLKVKFAKPSYAKYAFVSDSNMRFGVGTEVFGPIHSNGGIRFDGVIHNLITSAKEKYNDPDHEGDEEFGVHTHVSPIDPFPPADIPNRPDIFKAGRQFPVPAVDFSGLTNDLSNLKNLAMEGGHHFPETDSLGYLIVLKEDDTFDLYKVTSLVSVPNTSCQNVLNQDGWGTWSVENTQFLDNYNWPQNGIVFAEDNIWVEGKINGAKITIAVGKFPDNVSSRKSITVNNDLLYTNYDGRDVISLIAQKNINTGLISDNDLRIDAALIAQNGRIGRYYYKSAYSDSGINYLTCAPHDVRQNLTLYGMLATKERYGYAYSDNTGYINRTIIYDNNLLYNPPPHFPVTSDAYEIISWEEVK